MIGRLAAALALGLALGAPIPAREAAAQEAAGEQAWVQIAALPTLSRATAMAADVAPRLPDLEGHYLGSGWYALLLGPYAPEEAEALRARLIAAGAIPRDAFLTDGRRFQSRFWPPGGAAPAAPEDADRVAAPAPVEAGPAPGSAAPPAPPAPEETREETLEEARASEARLTQAERELLQVALAWAGVYDGPIDGIFGRGTRAGMAAWQGVQGAEPTGILTARQRAALIAAYNAPLAGLDMGRVRDAAAGIEIDLPLGILAAPVVEPPFLRYDAADGSGVRILLISQEGDKDRLHGLYEIIQTLEIVPPEGLRERGEISFLIEGADARLHTTVEAVLAEDGIKGFALVWPAGDEARRARVLELMRASFRRLPGTLAPALASPGSEQAVDLVSGLRIRQPRLTASGFFVDGLGTAVTAAAAVATCAEVTIDETLPMRVALMDEALGLAVLEPEAALAPRAVAAFQTGVPRIGAEVAVAGYPFGGALARPALTFGTLADIRGLAGEEELKRLDLAALPGDSGGPVLDAGGAVVGMLLPAAAGPRLLPEDVSFLLDSAAILDTLERAGVEPATTAALTPAGPERLTREAGGFTVLVSCW